MQEPLIAYKTNIGSRGNRMITPPKLSSKIIRSTTPTLYHVSKVYTLTPQNTSYVPQCISVTNKEKKSFLIEKSTISTEPINRSFTTIPAKSPVNKHMKSIEEEKQQMTKEIAELTKENSELKAKIIAFEKNYLSQQENYEEKILKISSELNKRLLFEKKTKKKEIGNEKVLLEKLIADQKKEHAYIIETLEKDHKKTIDMYEMIIKELENNITELLNKNGMLNLSLKERERKINQLEALNMKLNKQIHNEAKEKL